MNVDGPTVFVLLKAKKQRFGYKGAGVLDGVTVGDGVMLGVGPNNEQTVFAV